jgi:predicted DNA-binding protein (MmcQ/YjbR family)
MRSIGLKKRIGVELSYEELTEVETLISKQECSELVKWEKGNDVSVYKVKWRELTFYAIYNTEAEKIISFKNLDQDIYIDAEKYFNEY